MDRILLNPCALDANGKYVSVEHAQKGQEYFCPLCHQQFVYCQKGKGPHAHQDHFKHKVNSSCAGPSESDIHRIAKEGIYEILRSAIEKHQDINISWTCTECGLDFKGNLLKRAKKVEMEKNLKTSRPDIALLDENDNTIVAIEIVFTHDVTDKTLTFYDNNNIVLIRILVHSAEDCNNLMQKLQFPDRVDLCFNINCPRCQNMQVFRRIVSVVNQNKQIVGLTVAIDNPFEDEPIIGSALTEQDKRNALEIAKQYWPGRQFTMIQGPDFPYVAPVQQQTVNMRTQFHYRPQRNHPDIDTLMHQRQVKAIRRNYAIRNKSAKKSGGKRRH